jgi:hypothetical protein
VTLDEKPNDCEHLPYTDNVTKKDIYMHNGRKRQQFRQLSDGADVADFRPSGLAFVTLRHVVERSFLFTGSKRHVRT